MSGRLRVLIACEFSGVVRDAFARRGHDAWSCDWLESERAGAHHRMDIRELLDGPNREYWDLLIAHPPCTYLAVSGARWWKGREREQRWALDLVRALLDADVHRIALENPIGKISTAIRKPDQIIQPYMFGHPETKATCLWLKNLPLLVPTNDVRAEMALLPARERHRVHHASPGPDRWKERSRTLIGLANAMADQWGSLNDQENAA